MRGGVAEERGTGNGKGRGSGSTVGIADDPDAVAVSRPVAEADAAGVDLVVFFVAASRLPSLNADPSVSQSNHSSIAADGDIPALVAGAGIDSPKGNANGICICICN